MDHIAVFQEVKSFPDLSKYPRSVHLIPKIYKREMQKVVQRWQLADKEKKEETDFKDSKNPPQQIVFLKEKKGNAVREEGDIVPEN